MTRHIPADRWQLMNYEPNEWALEHVHTNEARFITGTTCRQVGKTITGGIELDAMLISDPDEWGRPPLVGLLGPTYAKAELLLREYEGRVIRAFGPDYFQKNKNDHRLWLPHNGAQLQWMSGTDPESVVGYTFSDLITDESQNISDEVWNKLYPTLSVREARVVSFGTPDIKVDQTWFRGQWNRGQDRLSPQYHSFTVDCYENPWITLEEIDNARETMTVEEFRMLMLAKWPALGGQVFRGWQAALLLGEPVFDVKRRHIMSVDFGLVDDFTVVMLGEKATRTVIKMVRIPEEGSLAVYDQIEELWESWGRPHTWVDNTGAGMPMADELANRGMRLHRVTIGPGNKMPMVGRLAADMQHRRIQFPDWPDLGRELDAYTYERTPSGSLTANASAGFHDDCVWALILLNEGMHSYSQGNDQTSNYLHADPMSWEAENDPEIAALMAAVHRIEMRLG